MVAVDDRAQREEREVLGERHAHREAPGVDIHAAAQLPEGEPEHDAVPDMDGEAGPPARASGHELAEQRDVGVGVAKDTPVDRLLERPRARGDGSGGCLSEGGSLA